MDHLQVIFSDDENIVATLSGEGELEGASVDERGAWALSCSRTPG